MWVKYYIPSYLYAGLIFALSSYSLVVPPSLPSFSDEWIHFFEYSIFGFLLARSYSHANTQLFKKYFIIFAFLTGVTCGLSDEYYQSFVPHRGAEFFDFIGDGLGISAGAIFYKIIRNFYQIAE
mgnify:CR=1 FL=1